MTDEELRKKAHEYVKKEGYLSTIMEQAYFDAWRECEKHTLKNKTLI